MQNNNVNFDKLTNIRNSLTSEEVLLLWFLKESGPIIMENIQNYIDLSNIEIVSIIGNLMEKNLIECNSNMELVTKI